MDPIITTLFAIYAALVATVVTGLLGIFLRMLTLAKHQGVLQGNLEGVQQQLVQINGELTGLNDQFGREIGRLNDQFGREIGRLNDQFGREIGRLDGKIDSRIDRLDDRIDRLDDRIDRLDNKVDGLREEMQRGNDILREEMRSNTDRIIQVLISHSHQDGSPPVFNLPPESEPVAADN